MPQEKLKKVTDPKILEQLESKRVTDPNLLAQLEGGVGAPPTDHRANVLGILAGPGQRVQTAAEDFRRGDIASGVFGGATAGLQTFGLPLSLAAYGLENMEDVPRFPRTEPIRALAPVGKVVAGLMEDPASFLSGLGGAAQDLVTTFTGVEPPTGQKEFIETGSPFLAGALAPKATGAIRTATTKVPAKLSARHIRKGNVALERAIPATSKELTRPQDRARMVPYLAEEQRRSPVQKGDAARGGTQPSVIRQLAEEKIPAIKQRIWGMQDEFIARNEAVPIPTEPVARSVESLRNIYTKNVDVLADQSILGEAAKYRGIQQMTLREATEMLRSLNADLQKFYKQANESQAAAQNAAKPIAEMERAARAIRGEIARALRDRGERVDFYQKLHEDYGAAVRMEAAAERGIARAESPLPPMFTERASQIYPSRHGVAREIAEHTIGRFFTPDKLATRAMQNYAKSEVRVPPPPPIQPISPRGYLAPPPIELGSSLGGTPPTSPPPFVHYGAVGSRKGLPARGGTRFGSAEEIPPTNVSGTGARPDFPPRSGGVVYPVWDPRTRQVIYVSADQYYSWDARFRLPLE